MSKWKNNEVEYSLINVLTGIIVNIAILVGVMFLANFLWDKGGFYKVLAVIIFIFPGMNLSWTLHKQIVFLFTGKL